MAQKTTLVDDLDGTPIDGDGGTVHFALDGTSYEIDLSEENETKLRDSLADFIANARRVRDGGTRPSSSTTVSRRSTPEHLKAVREWANSNGHPVADRGRLPGSVLDAYAAAH